jgi:hypothetical protein
MSLLSIVAGGADRPLLENREKWRTPVPSGQPTKTDTSYTLPGKGAHPPNICKQADSTINGPLKDEATGLIDTAATATATGVITAKSAGTSLTKAAMKELSGAFTELFGIIEYGKVMLKMGHNMVAGCE